MAGTAGAAHAQQTTPTPVPLPSPARPSTTTLPNVTPERFTLAPPAATPTPSPVLAPPPVVVPTPIATATSRATPPARPTPTPSARTAPAGQLAPPAAAAPTPAAVPSPVATAAVVTPVATPSPQSIPEAAAPPSSGIPGWLWALIGAGATALVFGGIWALRRRRPEASDEEIYEVPAAAAPAPPVPARPVAPPPGLASPPPAAPSGEPFEILLQPGRIEVTERDVVLDFELLVGNIQPTAAENIRLLMAMMSANPDQDRNIAGYHANPITDSAGTPFDLAAGAGGRMPVRLALPREMIHIVQVHGRPMFVPMVMIELKWRAGISIRRFGVDFMIGTPGQAGKLGPIWLDRNQQASQLTAMRYFPRQAVAA